MKILSRLIQLAPSDTLSINNLTLQLESNGKTVYKFGFGQSPFPIPRLVQNSLKKMPTKKIICRLKDLIH